jgi:mono/diheme cytochrome c family protein
MNTILAWAVFLAMATSVFITARAVSDPGERTFEYMGDMVHSLPYDSFSPNLVTRDGKTLQAPVAGTVPRGFEPFRYGSTQEEAIRAGRELRNPVPLGADALARGRELYETFCLVCHGEQGQGDGPLVPRIPNPPAYTSERVREMNAGQIYHVISRGSGRMPSYATQIPSVERWLIVHYVDTLRAEGRQP